jgi:hypothetical protein
MALHLETMNKESFCLSKNDVLTRVGLGSTFGHTSLVLLSGPNFIFAQ